MGLFLLKRLATFVATLVAASVVIFLVLEILPGDASQMMMGPDASPDAVRALSQKPGLDRPPLERYLHHNKIGDVGLMGPSQLGIAIPNVWFAILSRITRSAVLEALRENFVRTACAKGLARRIGIATARG